MGEISRFHGIVIRMYFRDHAPPHFHAVKAEFRAAKTSGSFSNGRLDISMNSRPIGTSCSENSPRIASPPQVKSLPVIPSVTHARADGYLLYLRFDDGAEGTVDLRFLAPFKGVFAPFADRA